ncbi:MAG TPA: hypothetical protein VHL12_07585 [Gemmatimonadaceae bacterium]|jgi:hypothetical protein|nr:hypothetical protein [Gemmatimonadaceae bacterium]
MAADRQAVGIALNADEMMPMPPRRHFIRKLLRNFGIATAVIGGGLFIGMAGYHGFGRMDWSESFYYAAMILSGEGPPPDPAALGGGQTVRLHLFAGVYALFSGVTFITMVGVLLAPVLHRFLHRFHLEIATHDSETD